jgi:hypothetical protein
MKPIDYWKECVANAAEECELDMTVSQLTHIADAVMGGHECYGMAFYSPPASDRIAEIGREWETKLRRMEAEMERYRDHAESALKKSLGRHRDARIYIDDDGNVCEGGGRTEILVWG